MKKIPFTKDTAALPRTIVALLLVLGLATAAKGQDCAKNVKYTIEAVGHSDPQNPVICADYSDCLGSSCPFKAELELKQNFEYSSYGCNCYPRHAIWEHSTDGTKWAKMDASQASWYRTGSIRIKNVLKEGINYIRSYVECREGYGRYIKIKTNELKVIVLGHSYERGKEFTPGEQLLCPGGAPAKITGYEADTYGDPRITVGYQWYKNEAVLKGNGDPYQEKYQWDWDGRWVDFGYEKKRWVRPLERLQGKTQKDLATPPPVGNIATQYFREHTYYLDGKRLCSSSYSSEKLGLSAGVYRAMANIRLYNGPVCYNTPASAAFPVRFQSWKFRDAGLQLEWRTEKPGGGWTEWKKEFPPRYQWHHDAYGRMYNGEPGWTPKYTPPQIPITATTQYRYRIFDQEYYLMEETCPDFYTDVATIIIRNEKAVGSITTDKPTICKGDKAVLTGTDESKAPGFQGYEWELSTNGGSWKPAPGTNNQPHYTSPSGLAAGTYRFRRATTGYNPAIILHR